MTSMALATDDMYDDEIAYWRHSYSSKSPAELQAFVSPTRPLDRRILTAVPQTVDGVIRVLDVGCGPVSVLGWHHDGVKIELTGADPLADQYARLLSELGVSLPHPSYPLGGEELRRQFAARSFDYVYSRNALDHAADAPLSVRNMVDVTREGGVVEIEVFENEGVAAGYSGLHRWNFCQLDEQILVWNRSISLLLDNIISPYPYTFEIMPKGDGTDRNLLLVTIHKCGTQSLKHDAVDGIVDIYSDLGRRILQLRDLRGDRSKKLFLHAHGIGLDGSETGRAKSYDWPLGAEVLNLRLPPMREISSAAIGQFHVEYTADGNSRYVNHWRTEISP